MATQPKSQRGIYLSMVVIAVIIVIVQKFNSEQHDPRSKAAGENIYKSRNYETIPANDYAKGLVFDGLEISPDCPAGFKLHGASTADGKAMCTHGPDPAPPGVDITVSVPPLVKGASTDSNSQKVLGVTCDSDGTSGYRVQVLYAHASDVASRYSTYLASIQQWAANADAEYYNSAVDTGGSRRIRFVHDAGCNPIVPEVTLTNFGDDTFSNMVNELQAQGYNRSDRKYMIFMDATVYCGFGGIWNNDSLSITNRNNSGPSYGRSDAGCWNGGTASHELMHNLGGVQLSAPHTSGGWHCIDEYDRMCYSDSPNYPTMQYLCPNVSYEQKLDCNHDDYFNTNPSAGNYLATHWNTANNQFLIGALPIPIPTPTPTPTPTPKPTPTPTPTPPPKDTIPPTVAIQAPSNGEIVTKNTTVTVVASASDNVAVAYVDIYLDTVLKCKDPTSLYTCLVKFSGKSGSTKTVTAKAYDTSGNSSSYTTMVTLH